MTKVLSHYDKILIQIIKISHSIKTPNLLMQLDILKCTIMIALYDGPWVIFSQDRREFNVKYMITMMECYPSVYTRAQIIWYHVSGASKPFR